MPNSLAVQLSNGIMAVIMLVVVSGPLWNFVPRAYRLASPWGEMLLARGIFLSHVGLILWPIAVVLFVNLLRQKRWTGLLQSAFLIALCVWKGWGATLGVIWTWTHYFRWLAHFFNN